MNAWIIVSYHYKPTVIDIKHFFLVVLLTHSSNFVLNIGQVFPLRVNRTVHACIEKELVFRIDMSIKYTSN